MLVSAIMVTGKSPGRLDMANVAIRCFLEQTHPDKELVIVNDGGVPFNHPDPCIRETLLPFSPETTLGDLRNTGLENSRGELVIQWDDDDWHHPLRIEVQSHAWEKDAAVLLESQIRYNTLNKTAFLAAWRKGIDGTILHERLPNLRYPSQRKAEDTRFLDLFPCRDVLTSPLPLYIRFFHGANTWNEKHIMGRRSATLAEGEWELSDPEQQMLVGVLADYYPWL